MTSLLLLSSLAFANAPGHPCGFQPPTEPFPAPVLPRSAPGELQVRDAFATGAPFSTHETDHTVIHWGPALDPSEEHLALLAADLELSWARQIEEMGWLPPTGSDFYKLNVYLGNSGGGAPEIDFSGGYVWIDGDGFAYITLSPDSLEFYDFGLFASNLVAHEFNHTLQIRDSAFSAGRHGPFLWEATANWAAEKTLQTPPSPYWSNFLLHPHLSLDSHAIFSDDVEREARQYDTALFVWYLSDQYTIGTSGTSGPGLGDAFVRDAWMNASPEDEPLAWLDSTLPDGLQPVYTDFALNYALESHDLAELYAEGMDDLTGFGSIDDRLTERVPDTGTDGWERPPRDLRPEAWAWNRLRWDAPGTGRITVSFEPNATGSDGTPARLEGFVVHRADGASTWTTAALETPIEVDRGDAVQLLVVSTTPDAAPFERFNYEYAFDADIEVEDDPFDDVREGPYREAACGCRTSGAALPAVGSVMVLLPLLLRRRSSDLPT
jgi:hypothetical protein